MKRAICYIEIKEYQSAEIDLDKILEMTASNCEALYFKGFLRKVSGDHGQAILIYEQAIKLNNSETATVKALHDMSLIYVEQKDMYAAYFALDRIDEIPEQLTYLIKAKTFLSGTISLIKKKYTEGIDQMNKVVNEEELAEILKPLVLSYRAYGYYCTGEIENALNDYKELQKKYKIQGGDIINMELCHGILAT